SSCPRSWQRPCTPCRRGRDSPRVREAPLATSEEQWVWRSSPPCTRSTPVCSCPRPVWPWSLPRSASAGGSKGRAQDSAGVRQGEGVSPRPGLSRMARGQGRDHVCLTETRVGEPAAGRLLGETFGLVDEGSAAVGEGELAGSGT